MTSNPNPMERNLDEQRKAVLLARIDSLRGVRNAAVEDTESGPAVTLLAIPEADESRLRSEVKRVGSELGLEVADGSVVFLTSGARGTRKGRRTLSRVNTDHTGGCFIASVSLELGGDILTGEQKSSDSTLLRLHSVAQAALNASRDLLQEPAEIEDVCLVEDDEQRSVLVSILLGNTPLLGAARVRFDEYDATARAVLDAVNRIVSRSWTLPLEEAV